MNQGSLSSDRLRPPVARTTSGDARPRVEGKFLFVGNEKFYVRGVTYGTFAPRASSDRPDDQGSEYHDLESVKRDFAQMTENGINAVRTYTVPPPWFLDAALEHGLRVMIGLPWEQHVSFLEDRERIRSIHARVRAGVHACARHPAVLSYAIGNEIPASIVRWYGPRTIERFLYRLYHSAKAEDPDALFTYVNFPTTEFLQLPFIDLVCFNLFLESQDRFEAYLAHLHTVAGDRPLIMAELGLDSRRNGTLAQAHALDWQVRSTFAAGCAGAFAFAWTDEWHRGEYEVEDWDFGLTDRSRTPKPALAAVSEAFHQTPLPHDMPLPRISVVVCSYNAEPTLRDCFEGLRQLDYPDYEVIVVDDGSSDGTAAITGDYGFRLIRTENRGLSNARNTGMEAATGEIIAYLDSDARPDPSWLSYLAHTFLTTKHAAVGGPNLSPPGDGEWAEGVANAPGAPIHVLLSDSEAEHIPGCNMSIRKNSLQAIGGFDPQFRVAGDDVDVCWRLHQRGWTLGFNPAAFVWHHSRNSIRAYWKQQVGYGKAEALLQRKWPEKYNPAGHIRWTGRLYNRGAAPIIGIGKKVFYGAWGTALFQSVYEPAPTGLWSLPLMPEWYLVILVLAALSALGLAWHTLLLALPLLAFAIGTLLVQAVLQAVQASFTSAPRSLLDRFKLLGVTTCLHLLQPLARLWGRMRHGLTVWRRSGPPYIALPRPFSKSLWSEHWQAAETRLEAIEKCLREEDAVSLRGGEYDRWDLEVRTGTTGAARLLMAVEEHGSGKQLIRFRCWQSIAPAGFALLLALALLALGAALDHAWIAYLVLAAAAFLLTFHILMDCATATAIVLHALRVAERANAQANQVIPLWHIAEETGSLSGNGHGAEPIPFKNPLDNESQIGLSSSTPSGGGKPEARQKVKSK
jgi:GT2 family glycosyltransferase